jgi:biotin carboxyl carrier protein
MTFPKLPVLVEKDGAVLIIRSPAVGLYSLSPESGSILVGGNFVGRLTILNQSYDLVLPPDAGGRVSDPSSDEKITPVEHGQALFRLTPIGLDQQLTATLVREVVATDVGVEGAYPILSPTDGIFYRRANPDAEPYVKIGDRVTTGQPLGLVEVMKCFNPIQYGEPSLPPEAEIVKICAEDGAEVKSEQVLFLVR